MKLSVSITARRQLPAAAGGGAGPETPGPADGEGGGERAGAESPRPRDRSGPFTAWRRGTHPTSVVMMILGTVLFAVLTAEKEPAQTTNAQGENQ